DLLVAGEDPLLDLEGDDRRITTAAGIAHQGTSSSMRSRTISSPRASFAGSRQVSQRSTAPRGRDSPHRGQIQRASTGTTVSLARAQTARRRQVPNAVLKRS